MIAVSERTWPLPNRPWVMGMTWSELLFAHWAVEPSRVERLIPAGLDLDVRDGSAWIGVVPFLMSNVSARCCPRLPKVSRFLELNVRTYVSRDGKPGVWFFSLDAESPLAVRLARAAFHLPYLNATMSLSRLDTATIAYHSERTHRRVPAARFIANYRAVGDVFVAEPGSLEYWLTSRYCLYSVDRHGQVYRGEIDHPPWQLAHAEWSVRENTMGEPLGLDLTGQPHLLFAQPINVRAWTLTRCH
jgi:hypothetical protein